MKVTSKNASYSFAEFPITLAKIMDLQTIEMELGVITDNMRIFNNLVSDLEINLDGDEHILNRLSKLEQMRKEILDKYIADRNEINEMI